MTQSQQTVILSRYKRRYTKFEMSCESTANSTRVPGVNQYALNQNIQQQVHLVVAQADGVHNAFVTATPANSANTPWGRDGEVVMAEARVVQNEAMGTFDGRSACSKDDDDASETNTVGDDDDDAQTLLSYPTESTLTFQS